MALPQILPPVITKVPLLLTPAPLPIALLFSMLPPAMVKVPVLRTPAPLLETVLSQMEPPHSKRVPSLVIPPPLAPWAWVIMAVSLQSVMVRLLPLDT